MCPPFRFYSLSSLCESQLFVRSCSPSPCPKPAAMWTQWAVIILVYESVSHFLQVFLQAGWIRLLGRTKPGIYPSLSWESVRVAAKLDITTGLSNMWAGGLFYAHWLRANGAIYPKGSGNNELGPQRGLLPDVTVLGPNRFGGAGGSPGRVAHS